MHANASESRILKLALFATGLSGIVAEYVLSTLATYFLGDSVFQWTMILSIMLFSMGLGSRISRAFEKHLLEIFLVVEFILSLLAAFCALLTYTYAAKTEVLWVIIYGFSIAIGLLIGMEIPLVMRINDRYENLRANIASVMEKDYLGSLVGGVFFAFIGLPLLGLTYTPFILGGVNFAVAMLLFFRLRHLMQANYTRLLGLGSITVFAALLLGVIYAEPIVQFGEQKRYRDKVIFEKQTRYQKIVLTQWKDNYWLYLNSHLQLSSFDEFLYHEPLVHSVMGIHPRPQSVLILGGGDGCALREVLQYPEVEEVILVDLDPEMTKLGQTHPVLTELNEDAFESPKVKVINADAFNYLEETKAFFDVMIIDFPDPKTVELNRLYTKEFYHQCFNQLRPDGLLITQSGSPYYATRAFRCIGKSVEAAGFSVVQMHNQVLTMGQWGWTVGSKKLSAEQLKQAMRNFSPQKRGIETEWLTQEAMQHMTHFGKDLVDTEDVEVNAIHNPVLYQYYNKGNWDVY